MDSFKNIFDSSENKYSSTGSSLENFRFARDIYGFCLHLFSFKTPILYEIL